MAGAFASLGSRMERFDFSISGGVAWFGYRYSECDPILGEGWPEAGSTFALMTSLEGGLMLSPRTGLAFGAMGYLPYLFFSGHYGPEGGNIIEIRGGLFYEW